MISSDSYHVFRRAGGRGWLVLAGEMEGFARSLGLLSGNLLVHADLSQPPRLVLGPKTDHASATTLSRSIEQWLGSRVQRKDLASQTIGSWVGKGLIVLAGGPWRDWLETLASFSPREVLDEGSLVCAVGPAAETFGRWIFPAGEREPSAGLSWLPGAVVQTDVVDPVALAAVRGFLSRELYSYAISLPAEAVLALGPAGEVEVWSREAPTVILGVGWRQA